MRQIQSPLASLLKTGFCALLVLGAVAQASAQKADPAGKWGWTMPGRNGGPDRKFTLTLKVEGDKLTGKLVTPGRGDQTSEIEIKEGTIKGDEISFKVTTERGGNTMTTKYTAKITGDTLKGKTEREGGTGQPRDWEAKRDKAAEKK